MSSDDEDGLCRFGTPLDPIEEDEVPTTKKITLADQIAVDSNGKRRFHGAFTGGFSAGFWNTVGSREGWLPSEFKSSRSEKATRLIQTASDFMDDEDIGEFGIAPQRIQTTDDFGPSDIRHRNKRKLQSNTVAGPIPGVPVLEFVLESCRDKAAIRLLKRMDKRYVASFAEKQNKPKQLMVIETQEEEMIESNKHESIEYNDMEATTQGKVYKCDMGPMKRPKSDDESNSSDDLDEELVFDEDELDSIFEYFKTNRFGLGYKSLDKGNFFTTVGADAPVHQTDYNKLSTFTMVDQHKKNITIRGQAFGVGAFEEDDDDIYGREDMSKYDFRLENQLENGSSNNARATERGFVVGFSGASAMTRIAKKHIYKVTLPFGFEPRNWLKRKSRFGPEVPTTSVQSAKELVIKGMIGRHGLTPEQRGQLLDDKITAKKNSINNIDVKLKAAGLKTMNFTTGGIENKTNDEPTTTPVDSLSEKIDENLSKIRNKSFVVPENIPHIFDRFTASNDAKPLSELNSVTKKATSMESLNPDAEINVKRIVRTKSTWMPCQLLCFKMNMETNVGTKPEKGNSFSLFECIVTSESARRNRLEFTTVRQDESDQAEIRKIADKSQESINQMKSLQNIPSLNRIEEKYPVQVESSDIEQSILNISNSISHTESKSDLSVIKRNKPKTELELKIISLKDEHPSKKKDIFKAIFDTDSESENFEEDDEKSDTQFVLKISTINKNVMSTFIKPSTSSSALYAQLPDEAFKAKSAREINILRNTSPPRGIFSGLTRKCDLTTKTPEKIVSKNASTEHSEDASNAYGPSLPPPNLNNDKLDNCISQVASNSRTSISLGRREVSYEEKWIEKTNEKEKKSKKEKKHKKYRVKHKIKKEKKEKHKKNKR